MAGVLGTAVRGVISMIRSVAAKKKIQKKTKKKVKKPNAQQKK